VSNPTSDREWIALHRPARPLVGRPTPAGCHRRARWTGASSGRFATMIARFRHSFAAWRCAAPQAFLPPLLTFSWL